ncbi:MAG: FHA domain-containing protein [Phototrophicaceae bacterium]
MTNDAMTCHICGQQNLIGTIVCTNCFTMLNRDVRLGTHDLSQDMPEFQSNPVFAMMGTDEFSAGMFLRLELVANAQVFRVKPHQQGIMIGRRDATSRQTPDIDLEDHGGYQGGVSRKHARIMLFEQELVVQDNGSANGTFLNGVRLAPHQATRLHDGDELRLGRMSLRMFFISQPSPESR